MKCKKLAGAASLALTVCILLSACAPGKTSGGTSSGSGKASSVSTGDLSASKFAGTSDPDMITINLQQDPAEMNSMMTSDTASGAVLREAMAGLIKLDKNDKPVPDLAESWTISNDKKTFTFKLRKGAKWSNGEPVTAKDYVFGWTTAMKKSTGSPYSYILTDNIQGGQDYFDGKIKEDKLGVKALDDYTLQVTFNKPIPYALFLCSFQTYLPINEKAYKSIGADSYAKDANKIVTNGPYKIAEWQHDDHILLVKNDNYWDKANVNIKKIKIVMISDANAAMNAVKTNQLDFIRLQTSDQIAQMKAEGQPVAKYVDDGNWYIQYNLKRKPFTNAKVREAFGMAIDTANFCKNVKKDGSLPATGIVPKGIFGANGDYSKARGNVALKYDPAKAKQLLTEGLQELGMTASQLKPVLITSNDTAPQKESAYFQEQWKQNLGVDVELKPLAFKARTAAMNSKDFDFVYAGWTPDYNDPMTFLDMFMTSNGSNYGSYSNKTYDNLIATAAAESNAKNRQEDLIKAEKTAIQDAVISPLYFSVINYTTSSKITGGTYTAFQYWPGEYTDGAKIIKK